MTYDARTYDAEWMEDESRMKNSEMRMLQMIWGKTLKDKMNNEKIREMTGVVRLEEFLREKRMRWLGHVERMDEEGGPVKALLLEVDGTKKGKPRKRWKEVLECDMTARGLQRLDTQDRGRWQLGCKNQLTPACGKPLLGSRSKRKHIPGAKWWWWWWWTCAHLCVMTMHSILLVLGICPIKSVKDACPQKNLPTWASFFLQCSSFFLRAFASTY